MNFWQSLLMFVIILAILTLSKKREESTEQEKPVKIKIDICEPNLEVLYFPDQKIVTTLNGEKINALVVAGIILDNLDLVNYCSNKIK